MAGLFPYPVRPLRPLLQQARMQRGGGYFGAFSAVDNLLRTANRAYHAMGNARRVYDRLPGISPGYSLMTATMNPSKGFTWPDSSRSSAPAQRLAYYQRHRPQSYPDPGAVAAAAVAGVPVTSLGGRGPGRRRGRSFNALRIPRRYRPRHRIRRRRFMHISGRRVPVSNGVRFGITAIPQFS